MLNIAKGYNHQYNLKNINSFVSLIYTFSLAGNMIVYAASQGTK